MKKIVVVLVVFVANIVSVDAMKLEVRKEDEVDEFDKWLIANLANPYDEMKNNVIQKMILEYVNPNYEVRLFNNNVEVDTSKGVFVLE
ncbi:unknown [Firmicutes bacterium CAG:460]|nr:unknown [Firmicutes bacterium CAG:460]